MTVIQFLSTLKEKNINVWADQGRLNCSGPKDLLTDDLLAQVIAQKAEILQVLGGSSSERTIPLADRSDPLPLSYAQRRLWFLDRLEPGGIAYNIPLALHLRGPLDVAAMRSSLGEIARRHETLRTTFSIRDEQPVQVIAPTMSIPLPTIDLGHLPAAERWKECEARLVGETRCPFDLARGPLIRALLVRLAETDHVLLLTAHHIATDGWSTGILVGELAALYTARVRHRPVPLAPLPIQYADYAAWEQGENQRAAMEKQLEYWKGQLGGELPVLDLPTDYPRPPTPSYQGATCVLTLPSSELAGLQRLARSEGATLFMGLLAAFQTLLYRYTGQEDILVGAPSANRNQHQIEGLIGFFVNTLVLRTNLGGEPSFRQLLRRTRDVALDAYANQDVPFERLVQVIVSGRDASHSPLFQVLIAHQNTRWPSVTFDGLDVTRVPVDAGTAKFDLSLYATEQPHGLELLMEYSTDLYERATVERMLGHLHTLIKAIVAEPDRSISSLSLLTPAERQQIEVKWNATDVEYPRGRGVHELIQAQVDRSPAATAVVFEGATLTYRELNERANQLAHYLLERGVASGQLVGICVERSLDMVIGLLGILKAGGAYVPLDPNYPAERLEYMLTDAQVGWVVTQEALLPRVAFKAVQAVCLDRDSVTIRQGDKTNPDRPVAPEQLAYVIYTSGSTGRPKGVCVPHQGVVNLLEAMRVEPGLAAEDVLLGVTTLSFDICGLEVYLPLCVGAKLHLVSRTVAADGDALCQALDQSGATVMQATPATWRMLVEAGWQGTRDIKVLCGGEALLPDLAGELCRRSSSVWNLYGPTETTIWSLVSRVQGTPQRIPIGRPIANTQVHVLDWHHQTVPVGFAGELYIGGAGVARGYLGRPDLTAERFVPNPFAPVPGTRLYRTGDLARYLVNGELEFLGRTDHQVKLRGYRIELGEIEATLARHESVKQAAVVVRQDIPGDTRLVAYVVARDAAKVSGSELRNFLRDKLPEYMLPAAFVAMEALPLTPNGKLDRRGLPVPAEAGADPDASVERPQDYVELQLSHIWERVLNVRPVGATDNFFELGGHSLLMTRLMAEIEREFGRRFPLRLLFESPTVREMAARLREGGAVPKWSSLVPIQPMGSQPPLFCVPPVNAALGYYRLAQHLGLDQPVYALLATPEGDRNPFLRIEDEATYYVQVIRGLQPRGPYYLLGWSYGGYSVAEIAQQLLAAGETVALLAILDSGFEFRDLRAKWGYLLRRIRYLLGIGPTGLWERIRYTIRNLFKESDAEPAPHHTKQAPLLILPATWNDPAADWHRIIHYAPRRYAGKVTLFRSPDEFPHHCDDPLKGWGRLARGGLAVYDIGGDHGKLLHEPYVQQVARDLHIALAQARAEHPVRATEGLSTTSREEVGNAS